MAKALATLRDSVISLFLLFTAVFFVLRWIPGDPARLMAGVSATDEQVEHLRQQLGLDLPVWQQYFAYLRRLMVLDGGDSILIGRPVFEEIAERLPYTLTLVPAGMALAVAVAIPLGTIAAVRRGTLLDAGVSSLSVAATSIPAFWLALLLIDWFAVRWGLLPSSGADSWRNLILPAAVLAATQVGIIARLVRASVVDVLGSDFIRTARAKGLGRGVILVRHILRNAAVPVITIIGLQTGLLLGGAVVTETVFSWPGVGRLLITAVLNRDYPMIQALVLVFGVGVIAVNLIADFLVTIVDPRLR